ncbi:MAG: bifunctional diaminohydroxyphosphoribosylaminopyrimidine deaminase/5-amino-6-(5-phosphoribosylamino)uracil reductase RibD [Gammaproteobacteria bacterium]|nr:bifunctional diaminohydroxyphosphoribosylaminopyrimidine deaminase/5-amino-6-(5-phosphoribosylamino)uracil reductase RibD [Gammaproteobacteria bacterium]
MTNDQCYMARALRLAQRGLWTVDPNPRVGCVLVHNDEIVGEGWHQYTGEAHAEIHALQNAGKRAAGATCYVTLEPCCHHGRTPPCADALIEAGIARVVAAMHDPNPLVAGQGLQRLSAAGLIVETGLLSEQAERLNPGFLMRMRQKRPYIRCKLAMSLDGRTAMASGESQWITAADARRDVQGLRARSSAVMVGVGTVLADDPSLTIRTAELPDYLPLPSRIHQPLRVIVDQYLSMPRTAKMLATEGKTVIFTACDDEDNRKRLGQAEVVCLPNRKGGVDLAAMCRHLAEQEGVNEVLMESGATLSGTMLEAGLIDELVIYMAPVLMGDGARGLFHLPRLTQMSQRISLKIKEIRAVGQDWRITAYPVLRE